MYQSWARKTIIRDIVNICMCARSITAYYNTRHREWESTRGRKRGQKAVNKSGGRSLTNEGNPSWRRGPPTTGVRWRGVPSLKFVENFGRTIINPTGPTPSNLAEALHISCLFDLATSLAQSVRAPNLLQSKVAYRGALLRNLLKKKNCSFGKLW